MYNKRTKNMEECSIKEIKTGNMYNKYNKNMKECKIKEIKTEIHVQ